MVSTNTFTTLKLINWWNIPKVPKLIISLISSRGWGKISFQIMSCRRRRKGGREIEREREREDEMEFFETIRTCSSFFISEANSEKVFGATTICRSTFSKTTLCPTTFLKMTLSITVKKFMLSVAIQPIVLNVVRLSVVSPFTYSFCNLDTSVIVNFSVALKCSSLQNDWINLLSNFFTDSSLG